MQNMHMKKVRIDHLEQYNDLLRYAFQITEADLSELGWKDEAIRQSKFPVLKNANVLGWFDGDTLVSQIAVYPMKMNVHGAVCDMGFLTSVATYPEYAGKGLMSRLMKQSLKEMKENGQNICLLYPYSIPLYRKKGWEIISDKMTFSIKDFQLPKSSSAKGYVRRVAETSRELSDLHNRFAAKTHGCIFRNELAWEEYWRWEADDITVALYYSDTDEPLGYLVYLLKKEILYIKELITLNMEAWRGLWNYISAHESMIVEVKGNNYTNETVAFWFEDSDIKETIRPYMMGRIIDVEKFISQYNFSIIDIHDSISITVSDNIIEWNNISVSIEFSPNEQPCLSCRKGKKNAEMSIGTLSTMLMGYKRPDYLYSLGKIQASPSSVALLERIIPKEKPYVSDYI